MPWVKIEDSFLTHPKAIAAGKDGRALWFAGLLFAGRELTDGLIPSTALPVIAASAGVAKPNAAIKALTTPWKHDAAPLWETVEGGWQIHDYADYQPSAVDVRSAREKERARKARGRAKQGRDPATGELTSARNPPNVPPGVPPGQPPGHGAESRPESRRSRPRPPTTNDCRDSHVSPVLADGGTDDDEISESDLNRHARAVAQARSTRLGGGHGDAWIRQVTRSIDRTELARHVASGTTDADALDQLLDNRPTAAEPTPIHPAIHATTHRNDCPDCSDGWTIDDAGNTTRCATCDPTATPTIAAKAPRSPAKSLPAEKRVTTPDPPKTTPKTAHSVAAS